MAKEKNISFGEFFEGFKKNLKTSKAQESKLDISKLSDDIVGVQNKVTQHTKSMLSSMNSQLNAMTQLSDAFKSKSLLEAGSMQIPETDSGAIIEVKDGIKESFSVFNDLYELVSNYFVSRQGASDEMLKIASEANKLASDANDLTKDKIRSDLLAEKEREAEDAKKKDGSIASMLKSAVSDSGFFGKIVGIFTFLAGIIVGFVGEIFRKIKSLTIVKKILGIFDPVIDFIKGLKTLFTSGAGSMASQIKNLKLFKVIKTIFKPVTAIFSVVGKAFGFVVSTFSKAFDFIKPVFSFVKELGDGGGKLSKFLTSIAKFFKIGLKVGSTLAKGIPIIGQIIMVIEGLVYGIIGAFKGFTETEGNIVQKIVGGLKGMLSGILKGIVGSLVNIVVDFVGFIGGLFGFEDFKKSLYDFDVNKYIDIFFDYLFMPIDAIVDFFSDFTENIKKVGGFFTNLGAGMMDGLRKVGAFFGSIGDGIMVGLDSLSSFFGSMGEGIMNGLRKVGAFFGSMGEGIMNGLDLIGSFFSGIGENISSSVTTAVEMYKQYVMNVWGGFLNIFSNVFDKVGEMFGGIGESFSSGFGYLKQLWQGYIDKVTGVFTFIGDLVTKAADLFGSIGDKFMDQWDQISSKVSDFMSKLSSGIVDIALKAEELIKEALRMVIPDPEKNTSIKQPGYWALKAIPDAIIDYAYSKTPVPTANVEAAQLEVSGKSGSDAQALNDAGTSWGSNIVNIVNNSGGNVSNTSNNSQVKNIGSAAAPVSSGSLSWSPQ